MLSMVGTRDRHIGSTSKPMTGACTQITFHVVRVPSLCGVRVKGRRAPRANDSLANRQVRGKLTLLGLLSREESPRPQAFAGCRTLGTRPCAAPVTAPGQGRSAGRVRYRALPEKEKRRDEVTCALSVVMGCCCLLYGGLNRPDLSAAKPARSVRLQPHGTRQRRRQEAGAPCTGAPCQWLPF